MNAFWNDDGRWQFRNVVHRTTFCYQNGAWLWRWCCVGHWKWMKWMDRLLMCVWWRWWSEWFPRNWHWYRNDDTGVGAPSRCTAFGHRFFHSIRSQCSELIALVRRIEMATVSNVNFPQVDLQLANNALPKPTELYLPNVEMQSIISKLHCLAFLSHSFRIAAATWTEYDSRRWIVVIIKQTVECRRSIEHNAQDVYLFEMNRPARYR